MEISVHSNFNLTAIYGSSGLPAEFGGIFSSADPAQILAVLSEAVQNSNRDNDTPSVNDIDVPADSCISSTDSNLEKLVAKLRLFTDDMQVETTKERIESDRASINKKHEAQIEAINKSIEEAEKAEKNSVISKIFGWIAAAIAVAVAAIACVASGGIAIGAVVAAALAVAGAVIQTVPGATEKICDFLGDICAGLIKAFTFGQVELTDKQKEQAGAIAFAVCAIAASVATMFIPGGASIAITKAAKAAKAAGEAVKGLSKGMQAALKVTNLVMGLGTSGFSTYASWQSKNAADAEADAKEIRKILLKLQENLDEDMEILEQLLNQIQQGCTQVMFILSSQTNTMNDIMNNMRNSLASRI